VTVTVGAAELAGSPEVETVKYAPYSRSVSTLSLPLPETVFKTIFGEEP
jgi:hypothetical protein